MKTQTPLFEEKQYLGFNKYSLILRLGIIIFCLAFYFFKPEDPNAPLFLFLGMVMAVISLILLFVKHIHTRVYEDHLVLDGYWAARKVKIDIHSIAEIKTVKYNNFQLNSPVFNLHRKGTVRFYTRGDHAVSIRDKHGLVYVIGTQYPSELQEILSRKKDQDALQEN